MGVNILLIEQFLKHPFPIGVIAQPHGAVIGPHGHEFYELTLIGRGLATHVYNGKASLLTPGDLLFIRPGEVHSYVNTRDNLVYNFLFLVEGFGEDWPTLNTVPGVRALVAPSSPTREDPEQLKVHLAVSEWKFIETIACSMLKEQEAQLPGWELSLRFNMGQILIVAGRAFMENRNAGQGVRQHGQDFRPASVRGFDSMDFAEPGFSHIEPAVSFIEANLSADISISRLARLCHLSQGYFCRLFKEVIGSTPQDYIRMKRVEYAARRLHDVLVPISQVAEEVGILDPNYFSRIFKKALGMTPSGYRVKVARMVEYQKRASESQFRPME